MMATSTAWVLYTVAGWATTATYNGDLYDPSEDLDVVAKAYEAADRAAARAEIRLAFWRQVAPPAKRLAPVPRPRPARRPSYAVRHRSRQVRLYL